jgi:hypothetical protein
LRSRGSVRHVDQVVKVNGGGRAAMIEQQGVVARIGDRTRIHTLVLPTNPSVGDC